MFLPKVSRGKIGHKYMCSVFLSPPSSKFTKTEKRNKKQVCSTHNFDWQLIDSQRDSLPPQILGTHLVARNDMVSNSHAGHSWPHALNYASCLMTQNAREEPLRICEGGQTWAQFKHFQKLRSTRAQNQLELGKDSRQVLSLAGLRILNFPDAIRMDQAIWGYCGTAALWEAYSG